MFFDVCCFISKYLRKFAWFFEIAYSLVILFEFYKSKAFVGMKTNVYFYVMLRQKLKFIQTGLTN